MSVVDKLDAARHSISGSNLGKAACKATSREVMGPKRKHIDYLIQSTNSDNVSIPNLGDILFDRCTNSSWVVVFKALCTFHQLMSYGNERFIQYMASRTTNFNSLHNFLDKSGVQGYDMSTFVRRHANYLNVKAFTYREMGYDFCRLKRGKEEGVLRTMDATKLLKALPALQQQIDALLELDVKCTELVNGVVNSAFVLLFKDLIRLFACYNDGIINLLEGYFDMNKKDCKLSLGIYKKFLTRMDQVSAFLKVAEDVGFDKDDIPDLSKAPNSLLDALENHLQSLEKGKSSGVPASTKSLTIPTITVPLLASDAFSAGGFTTKFETDSAESGKKDELIEEEEKYLEAFKQAKVGGQPVASVQGQVFQSQPKPQPQPQPQQQPWEAMTETPAASKAADDLLQLNAMFAAPVQQMPAFSASAAFPPSQPFPAAQPFGQAAAPAGFGAAQAGPWSTAAPSAGFDGSQAPNPFGGSQEADFAAVFGGAPDPPQEAPAGNILMPTVADKSQQHLISKPGSAEQDKLPRGLDASLEKMAKSLDALSFNGNVKGGGVKLQHQWTPQQPQVKTGGANWQTPCLTSTSLHQPGWTGGQTSPTVIRQTAGYTAPFGQPVAQVPFMGQAGGFTQQPGTAYQQPGPQRPADPFGPVPGTQGQAGGFAQQPDFKVHTPATAYQQDPFGPVPGTQARF